MNGSISGPFFINISQTHIIFYTVTSFYFTFTTNYFTLTVHFTR